jgi:hypothetical protein
MLVIEVSSERLCPTNANVCTFLVFGWHRAAWCCYCQASRPHVALLLTLCAANAVWEGCSIA